MERRTIKFLVGCRQFVGRNKLVGRNKSSQFRHEPLVTPVPELRRLVPAYLYLSGKHGSHSVMCQFGNIAAPA
jgi:hypothetical protein